MAVTKKENLIIPEVLADMIDSGLTDAIIFSPLAKMDTTLVARAGDSVKLPRYEYIGDALDVGEGEAIPLSKLTATSKSVTVKKAGRGVKLTDEALLSGYGDPIGQAAAQLRTSIAQKVDNDCLTSLVEIGAEMTVGDGTAGLTPDLVADALVKFGENIDGEKVLIIAPAQLAELRKDENYINGSDMATDILIKGTVGMIHGCQIALSNKIKSSAGVFENFIVKPEALAIFLKRDTEVETDRDIEHKLTIATADRHYTTYLYDTSRAIKIKAKDSGAVLGVLSVTSEAVAGGKSKITVEQLPASGNKLVYKTTAQNPSPVVYDQVLTSWTELPEGGEITPTAEHTRITVAEVDTTNKAKKAGNTTLVVGE